MDKITKFFKSTAGMVLLVTILVGIVVHITTGNFFTAYNISTLTRAASFVIIIGFGQTIVLLTGGIDLSVATIGSVCGMASAIFMVDYGMNPFLAIILSSLIGVVLGGTSMAGGIGSVAGTIIGGILSSVISTCITLLRISSYWETIVTGAVVLIAVLIDAIKDNPVIQIKIKRFFSRN